MNIKRSPFHCKPHSYFVFRCSCFYWTDKHTNICIPIWSSHVKKAIVELEGYQRKAKRMTKEMEKNPSYKVRLKERLFLRQMKNKRGCDKDI